MKTQISRRDFLRGLAVASAGTALVACGPSETPTAEVPEVPVEQTVEVPVEQTVVVERTVVVEATEPPLPVPPEPEPSKVAMMVDAGEFSDDDLNAFLGESKYVSEVERIGTDTTRLRAMWAAGNPPDVWRASGADVPTYVMLDWPLDLTDYFNTSDVLKPDDMASAVGYFQYQGGWYGMHKDFSPDQSLQINVAAFEEAGVPAPEEEMVYTYQDCAEWARALTLREGERTVRIGWADNEWWDGIIQTILMEEGEDIFTPDFAKANIAENPKIAEVFSFYAQLAEENVIWNPLNPSPSWPGDDLVTGRAAIIRYGYWMHGVVIGAEDPTPFEMRPALSWSGKAAVNPPLGGAGWFVAKTTQVPISAWELFEYYMGGPPAEGRARSGWGLPALKSMFPLIPQDTDLDKQWYDSVMWELENTVQKPRQLNPFISTDNINSAWASNMELYLKGEITVDEAIANIDKEVNDALRERINALYG